MKQFKVKYWLEQDGEKFYGPGPHELLQNILEEGSLSKAAMRMHLSYKKAWTMVQRLNRFAEKPLVILKKGGSSGGGAELTDDAIGIMKEYDDLQKKMQLFLKEEEKAFKFLK